MKILNAKGLVHYASAGGFPDKEGYLLKRGDLNKDWQKRWFMLRGNLLFYSEKRGDKEPTGVIVLEGCAVEVADCERVDNFAFQLAFPGSGARTYVLSAASQEEMEAWLKVLSCAPYDYIRLLVGELDSQLKETVDTAMLVQLAERDSRIVRRTYSTDQRPRSTGEGGSVVGGGYGPTGKAGSMVGSSRAQSEASSASNSSSMFYDSGTGLWGDSTDTDYSDAGYHECVSMYFTGVDTWQRLGIKNFHEMHDEIRRQIREFSASKQ